MLLEDKKIDRNSLGSQSVYHEVDEFCAHDTSSDLVHMVEQGNLPL